MSLITFSCQFFAVLFFSIVDTVDAVVNFNVHIYFVLLYIVLYVFHTPSIHLRRLLFILPIMSPPVSLEP